MKVLMMVTSFQIGGTERQVVNVAAGLDRERFDLHLASIHPIGELWPEVQAMHVPHPAFEIRSLYRPETFRQAFRLARYIRERGIQIVHTYSLYTNLFAIPAAKLAGAPVIICSIRDRGDILAGWQRWLQRQVCRLANCVLVNADAIRDSLVQQGYPAEKLTVIRNGFVPHRAGSCPGPTVREEFGIPAGAPVVLVLSRLNPMKGVEYFLDAAAAVSRDVPEARFVIVGNGANKRDLEAQAAQLGLAERAVFTGFRTDTQRFLSEATLSVLPSLSEGLSNTLLESMAAGVPVVATRVGGNPEAVEDGVSGLLVPVRDAGALAQAMSKVLRDPRLAQSMSAAGRRRIAERFSMQSSIQEVEALYAKLMEVPGSYLAEAAIS